MGERCASAVGVSTLPLLLLVPVALATQIRIPGLEQLQWQASQQIAEANTRLQQSLGIYQEDAARAAAQFNNAGAALARPAPAPPQFPDRWNRGGVSRV